MGKNSKTRPKNFVQPLKEHIEKGADVGDAVCISCLETGKGKRAFVKSWKNLQNLVAHNQNNHNELVVSDETAGNSPNKRQKTPIQLSLLDFVSLIPVSQALKPEDVAIADFEAKCALAIAVDLLPISALRKQGIQCLIASCSVQAKHVIPSDYKIKKALDALAAVAQDSSNSLMNKLEGLSLSFDGWTSKNGVISMTAFYAFGIFDNKWAEFMIDTVAKKGSSDAQSTFETIKTLFDCRAAESNVMNHRYAWVTDRPSVNIALFRDHMSYEYHLWCCCHRINLICQRAFNDMASPQSPFRTATGNGNQEDEVDLDEVAKKSKKIVTHFRKSSQATFRFDESCQESGKKVLRFLPECETRWTGRYNSWKRLLEHRETISNFVVKLLNSNVASEKKEGQYLHSICLTEVEWTVLSTIVPVLSDFVKIIEILSATGPTNGLVYPLLKNLRTAILSQSFNDSKLLAATKVAFRDALDFYFSSSFQTSTAKPSVIRFSQNHYHEKVLLLGWLFDPSQFGAKIVTGSALETLIESVAIVGKRIFNNSIGIGEKIERQMEEAQVPNPLAILGLLRDNHGSTYSSFVVGEMRQYLLLLLQLEACPHADSLRSINALDFWFTHQEQFPRLYRLSRVILSLPASATACERFFSICGLTISDRRSRLKLSTCRSIWLARSLFRPFGKENLPYLGSYIFRHVSLSSPVPRIAHDEVVVDE